MTFVKTFKVTTRKQHKCTFMFRQVMSKSLKENVNTGGVK